MVLGHEFVGRVVAAGSEVERRCSVGDRVVCGAGISCGALRVVPGRPHQPVRAATGRSACTCDGGLAEYVSSPAGDLPARSRRRCSDEAAAIAQPLAVALHAVRRSGVRAGSVMRGDRRRRDRRVHRRGRGRGAAPSPLIALDIDEERLRDRARARRRTSSIDARGRELDAAIRAATGGEGADVVIEASGAPAAPAAALAAARRGGRVLIVGLQAAPRELDLLGADGARDRDRRRRSPTCATSTCPRRWRCCARSDCADAVIDRVIGLDDLVEQGIEPLAAGRRAGKIVVAP